MRQTTLVSTESTAIGLVAKLTGLPTWCTCIIVLTYLALAAGPIVVTQIIRLRVSTRITTARAALQVLGFGD